LEELHHSREHHCAGIDAFVFDYFIVHQPSLIGQNTD
jgi:hypothetical protein